MKPVLIIAFAGILLTDKAQAVNCVNNLPASNPESAYTVNNDGTATDTRTGLVWKVCAEGQTWSAGTCNGTATTHTWDAALALAEAATYAGYSDWRLPNLKELRSLVEECRINPAINDTIFPNTPSSYIWSGSSFLGNANDSWHVDFNTGVVGSNRRGTIYDPVRLVRGGQSASSSTFAVADDFSATSNPNGVWSYGWKSSLTGSFQLFSQHDAPMATPPWDSNAEVWSVSGHASVIAYRNKSPSTLRFSTLVIPANAFVVHPGNAGEVTVARWTAPSSGDFSVRVAFYSADSVGVSTDVHVLLNGASIFQGIVSGPYGVAPTAYLGTLASINQGDVVDFVVGNGGNGYLYDSTRVDVSIVKEQ